MNATHKARKLLFAADPIDRACYRVRMLVHAPSQSFRAQIGVVRVHLLLTEATTCIRRVNIDKDLG